MLLHAILGLSPAALAALIGICILCGSAKGALGIGIPLLVVPLTAPFMDLPAVIALVAVPIFATNLGQAIEGTGTKAALLRLWPMLLAVVTGTIAGVRLLVSIDRPVLNGAVGVLLVLVAAWLFWQPRLALGCRAERWAGPPIGLLAGIMGGVSGMFGPPLIAYLIGLGLRPDAFVKHISILFLAAGAALLLALGGAGAMSWADIAVSTGALTPIYIGMLIGRWLRRQCPPALFRALVLVALAIGGLQMIRAALP
jgi:uncharacterized membrane protein YfcA